MFNMVNTSGAGYVSINMSTFFRPFHVGPVIFFLVEFVFSCILLCVPWISATILIPQTGINQSTELWFVRTVKC